MPYGQLVSRGTEVSHHGFGELPRLLRAGDLLVVNTSPTLAAAVDGWIGHARVVVHFSTRGDDGRWAVELREPDGKGTSRACGSGPGGDGGATARGRAADLGGAAERAGRAVVVGAVSGSGVVELLREYGRPIRIPIRRRDQPLSVYQTVFSLAGRGRGRQCECRVPRGPSPRGWWRSW
ncbi:S-adenosylmethionine:tRNA ribosyltransferase-isomerase [Streptomyces sp. L7]